MSYEEVPGTAQEWRGWGEKPLQQVEEPETMNVDFIKTDP